MRSTIFSRSPTHLSRSRLRTAAVTGFATLVWFAAVPPTWAGENDRIRAEYIGYMSQYAVAPELGPNGCVPTATTNLWIYLQNVHSQELGTKLAGSAYSDWHTLGLAAVNGMGTDHDGTSYFAMLSIAGGMVSGSLTENDSSAQAHSRGKAPFSLTDLVLHYDSTTANFPRTSLVKEDPIQKASITSFIADGHPVLTGIDELGGRSGHEILVNGINDHSIHFVDPLDPSVHYSSHYMEPSGPTKQTTAIYSVAPAGGHVFPTIHATTQNGSRRVPRPARVAAGTIYFRYDQYTGELPYRGYPKVCSQSCMPGSTAEQCAAAATRGPCETSTDCNHSIGEICEAGQRQMSGVYYVHDLLAVEITSNNKRSPEVTVLESTPESSTSARRRGARHRAEARCFNAKHRAVQNHGHCSIVRQAKGNTGAKCDRALRRAFAKAEAHGAICSTGAGISEYAEASHELAASRIEAAGIGPADLEDVKACSGRFAHILKNHSRSENRAQRLERREKKSASRIRQRAETKFHTRWNRVRDRSPVTCPDAVTASEVIEATVDAVTPVALTDLIWAHHPDNEL